MMHGQKNIKALEIISSLYSRRKIAGFIFYLSKSSRFIYGIFTEHNCSLEWLDLEK